MKKILLVAHHSGVIGGPFDKFYTYLRKKNKIIQILHPIWLNCGLFSIIRLENKEIKFRIFPAFQYPLEGAFTLFQLWKNYKKFRNIELAVCFDSLSFFHTFILKYPLGIKKIVYYNIDYSKVRYNNILLNFIYQQFNLFSYKTSDYFFSLTKKFIEDTDPKGKFSYKNYIVSNVVSCKIIKKRLKKYPNSIVFAGSLAYTVDFNSLLIALNRLKDENIKFVFDIYGATKLPDGIKKKILNLNLEKNVFLKGVFENEEILSNILPCYQIGVAPYLRKGDPRAKDHMFSGSDLSAKVIEYMAAGLPVLSVRLNDFFDVIEKKKFGYLVANSNDWYKAIKELFFNKKLYKTYKTNAIKFSKNYDEDKILKPIFTKIL